MNAITDKIHAVSEKTNRNIQIVDTIIPLVEEIQRLRLIVTTRTGDVDALERSWDELNEENMILKKEVELLQEELKKHISINWLRNLSTPPESRS